MILGISGIANSGKDTLAHYLAVDQGFAVISLADPIKRIAKEVFDFTDEQLWGPSEQRNKPDFRYPNFQCRGCQTCEFRCDHYIGFLTPRHALQQLGTDWGRACYENVWVEYTMRVAHTLLDSDDGLVPHYDPRRGIQYQPFSLHPQAKGVVIPDVRFENELKGIRAAGGKVVRIKRDGAGLSGVAGVHASESEQALIPDSAFDVVVDNNSTLDELRAKVPAIMAHLRP